MICGSFLSFTASLLEAKAQNTRISCFSLAEVRSDDRMKSANVSQRFFEKANKLAPLNATVMNNLAMAKAANGDIKGAESLLRSALAMPTAKPKVRKNLTLVLRLQGRDVDAQRVAQATGAQPGIRQSIAPQHSTNGLVGSQVARAAKR